MPTRKQTLTNSTLRTVVIYCGLVIYPFALGSAFLRKHCRIGQGDDRVR